MPIPTMAIACRPENTSSGPAVSTLLSGVIDSVETHVENLKIPTHLGFGIRFDLSSSDMSSEGKKLDVSCRIDLVSIDLGTSGPDDDESLVHPTPAGTFRCSFVGNGFIWVTGASSWLT